MGIFKVLQRVELNISSTAISAWEACQPFLLPATRENTGQWWPQELGHRVVQELQNERSVRLLPPSTSASDHVNGRISVYDTQDHQIGGFSQQQFRRSLCDIHEFSMAGEPLQSANCFWRKPCSSSESTIATAQVSAATSETAVGRAPKFQPCRILKAQDIFARLKNWQVCWKRDISARGIC